MRSHLDDHYHITFIYVPTSQFNFNSIFDPVVNNNQLMLTERLADIDTVPRYNHVLINWIRIE